MQTCQHRVYSDPDRDSYTYGVSCGKDAVAFSIHPATGEQLYWCVRHAREHGDSQSIEHREDAIKIDLNQLKKSLIAAQSAFEAAIDRDAPDETVRRLERIRDEAAQRLQMMARGVRS